jgi:hypothetical protein
MKDFEQMYYEWHNRWLNKEKWFLTILNYFRHILVAFKYFVQTDGSSYVCGGGVFIILFCSLGAIWYISRNTGTLKC